MKDIKRKVGSRKKRKRSLDSDQPIEMWRKYVVKPIIMRTAIATTTTPTTLTALAV